MRGGRRGDLLHLLYVPGDSAERLEEATSTRASGLFIDLEDGVPTSRKAQAREAVSHFFQRHPAAATTAIVRINDLVGEDWEEDIRRTIQAVPHYLAPKIVDPGQVRFLDQTIADAERAFDIPTGRVRLLLMIETAAAVIGASDLIAASDRVGGLVVGQADLSQELGCEIVGEDGLVASPLLEFAHAQTLYAAAAHQLPVFVSAWAPNGRPAVQALEMRRLFGLGYHGMIVGDPSTIEAVEEAWRPTAAQVAFAQGALDAGLQAHTDGRAFAVHEGWIIERSLLTHMEELIRRLT